MIAYIDKSCRACQRLSGEFLSMVKSQSILDRKIKFGFVDIALDENQGILERYLGGRSVDLTPTVLVYGKDKYQPLEYEGDYL